MAGHSARWKSIAKCSKVRSQAFRFKVMEFRTRIAPTPSGYLHLGNAWSFLYTWLWARSEGGRVFLRMDTMDADRVRDAYFHDIEGQMAWLGLLCDPLPEEGRATQSLSIESDVLDSLQDMSTGSSKANSKASPKATSTTSHMQALRSLIENPPDENLGWAFACDCSREKIRCSHAALAHSEALGGLTGKPDIYPGTCRHRRIHNWQEALAAPVIRWHIPAGSEATIHELSFGKRSLYPAEEMGDIVIRTRAGHIAYHLASLADDRSMQVTHIVRGEDLLPSTGAQIALAKGMGYAGFSTIQFCHHPLLTWDGKKLSKSEGAPSLKAIRAQGAGPEAVYRFFAGSLQLPNAAGLSLEALLSYFPQRVMPQHALRFEEFKP